MLFVTLLSIGFVADARADVITFDLPYIGPSVNPGPTFTGNGYATVFSDGSFVDAFSMDNAHSYFQLDISGLAGKTILSASLNFNIGGGDANQPVTVTSFASSGSIGSYFTPPNSLLSQVYTVDGSVGLVPNSLDVTALLAPRVAGGSQYFALHFAPVNNISNLYVQPTGTENLRLQVTYAVPEPSSIVFCSFAGVAVAGWRRLKRRYATV